jgi:tRNA dimethylallyltransferase
MVVGGTGLYIRSLIAGLIQGPPTDSGIRDRVRTEAEHFGNEHMYQQLQKIDPASAQRLHRNDTYRILRALEWFAQTALPISDRRLDHGFRERPYEVLTFALKVERDELYRRIDRRVDMMMAQGLKEEVEMLLNMGYASTLKPMQAIGYRQLVSCLQGRCDVTQAVREIKRDTRRYAKRQMTWFRADHDINWIEYPEERDLVLGKVKQFWGN